MVKELFRPAGKEEAVALLTEHQGKAKVLAGGTDLVVLLRAGKVTPEIVVSLNRIDELRSLSFNPDDGLRIGALVTHSELIENDDVRARYPVLVETGKPSRAPCPKCRFGGGEPLPCGAVGRFCPALSGAGRFGRSVRTGGGADGRAQ